MPDNIIYVIDDNVAVGHSLKFFFRALLDLNVQVYYNPLLFLEEFSVAFKGCLIIDLDMPGINGIELMKQVKTINDKIHVILISGHATEDVSVQSIDAGAYAFMMKPFNTEQLLTVVKTILKRND